MRIFLALAGSVLAVALTTVPAHARVDSVVPPEPVLPPAPPGSETGSCIVPAMWQHEPACSSPRDPGRVAGGACTLPVVYRGGPPGPCPERDTPPGSRIIPVTTFGLSR